jgi:hypothetical protein
MTKKSFTSWELEKKPKEIQSRNIKKTSMENKYEKMNCASTLLKESIFKAMEENQASHSITTYSTKVVNNFETIITLTQLKI